MKLRPRSWLIILGLIVIAAILAVPMRATIYNAFILPAAYIGWALGLLYRTLPQVLLWWLAVVIIFFFLVFSVLPNLSFNRRQDSRLKPKQGQVEDLSIWMGRAKTGVYFKWLIANRLGKLAYQILLHREHGRSRTVFTPLVGKDWRPSNDLKAYLETGLHGSFSDFPNSKRGLSTQQKTPLDYDIRDAVEFLESKVENAKPGV